MRRPAALTCGLLAVVALVCTTAVRADGSAALVAGDTQLESPKAADLIQQRTPTALWVSHAPPDPSPHPPRRPTPTRSAASAEGDAAESTESLRGHPSEVNPTLPDSGGGTLLVILAGLGICLCMAGSYVAYYRVCLGQRARGVWDWKHYGEYEPVDIAYSSRPPADYPVAYPPAGQVHLVDVRPPQQQHQAQAQRAVIPIAQPAAGRALAPSQQPLQADQSSYGAAARFSVDDDEPYDEI